MFKVVNDTHRLASLQMQKKMPKSHAEIQKAYWERQKEKKGAAYIEKEKNRKRQAYVPVSELYGKALKKQRLDQLERVQEWQKEKKESEVTSKAVAETSLSESRQTWNVLKTATNTQRLVVKLDFNQDKKRNASCKRVTRALSKAHRKIGKLEDENQKLQSKAWRLEKRIQ